MKRILSLVLVFTCIFSSFTFLASAEESTEESTEASTETSTEASTDESTEESTGESTGHVHERNPNNLLVYYTETTHRYQCSTCDEYYTENHIPAEEGKCPCGYFDHEHKPEAWFMSGMYTEETGTAHSYLCSECSNAAVITEEHTFDKNGVCPCGMYDKEKIVESQDLISVYRALFKIIPQSINFIMKAFSKMFEAAFEMVN